ITSVHDKTTHFVQLGLCLIGELWAVQESSPSDIIICQIIFFKQEFLKIIQIFIIVRTMASTLKLQLFRNIKPTVSISLDSPSMMSLGEDS
ncbi:hypothetical protein, partial [Nocardioides malaquae]|uniref:hypothetical protein n=1 Tax=Nocardioides malaquae TaxID=2773426 RepID=UPI001D0D4E6B